MRSSRILTTYPDELLISILARSYLYSGNSSLKATIREIYGVPGVKPALDLPSHINRVCKNLGLGISAQQLINNHTLYPYYRPFLSFVQASQLYFDMLEDHGMRTHAESGLMASSVTLTKQLFCCPICIQYDIQTYGEPYWHRVHHLPGVLVCPTHKVRLYSTCPTCNDQLLGNSIQELPIPVSHCRNGHSLIQPEDVTNQMLLDLAIDSFYILQNSIPERSLEQIQNDYINALYALGYVTPNGSVRQKDFLRRFLSKFSTFFLNSVGMTMSNNTQGDWLSGLVRKPRKSTHPLLHILLMEFLSGSVKHFFSNPKFQPFGRGQWPCLNKVAEHFKQHVITDLIITRCSDTGLPVGTFYCECGFVYSRRGPDKNEEDRFRYGRIKEFGHVWKNRLHDLASDRSLSMYAIAKKMETHPKVITKHLTTLPLNNVLMKSNNELETRRRQLLETIFYNPELTRTQIKKLNYKDYTWLYRHDREWLNQNLPIALTRKTVHRKTRVNWSVRDLDVSFRVEKATEKIINDAEKPKRITISLIGRMSGTKALLEKHLDKLPVTRSILLISLETILEFQKRRVDWTILELIKTGENVVRWKIVRKAGLKPNICIALSDYIDKSLAQLANQSLFSTIGGELYYNGITSSTPIS